MLKSARLKENFTRPGLLLMLAEVILFSLLAVFSSRHFGIADGAKITAAYLVAYLVPRTVLRRDSAWSWVSSAVLFLLSVLLIYIDYKRLLALTLFDGYSLEMPNLSGDARSYYKWALGQYDGRFETAHMLFPGFPYIMVGLWKIFGVSIVWPQAMNLISSSG